MSSQTPKRKRKYADKEDFNKVVNNIKLFLSDLKTKIEKFCNDKNINSSEFPVQISNVVELTAELCCVSSTKVKKASKNTSENIIIPKFKRGRKRHEWDSFLTAHVRRVCHSFYARKEFPTMKKLLETCAEDPNFPRIKKETFWKCLTKQCGFKYKRIRKKPVFFERSDIVSQREHYLRHLRHYRQLGYHVFYSDETWTSPDQSRKYNWQIALNPNELRDFNREWKSKVSSDVNGNTGGFLVKGGKGRVIINHIGGAEGFLFNGEDIFISKDNSADYHGSMNATRYLIWFQKILKLVPNKSVLVVDQASYHKQRVPGTVMPTMSWKKSDIVEFMKSKNIPLPDLVRDFHDMTKAGMIQLSKLYPVKVKYVIEKLAEECGKDIKLTELNPIELIWAFLKGKVSELNNVGGIQQVYELTLKCIKLVKPELWQGCIKTAIRFEEKFWQRDRLIERTITEKPSDPNLVIHLGSETESDSESDFLSDSSTEGDFDEN